MLLSLLVQVEMAAVGMFARQRGQAQVVRLGGCVGIELCALAPSVALGELDIDAIADPADPVPPERFDGGEPRATETGIGNDDGLAGAWQHGLQLGEEPAMGAWTVVMAERVNALEQRDGATMDDECGAKQHQSLLFDEIRPVHDDQRSRQSATEMVAKGTVDVVTLGLQMRVGEQPVHALDIVFAGHAIVQASAQRRDGEEGTFHQGLHCGDERDGTRGVQLGY